MGKIDIVGTKRMFERQQTCQQIARAAVLHLDQHGPNGFQTVVTQLISKQPDIENFTITRTDGIKLCEIKQGDHNATKELVDQLISYVASPNDTLQIPINKNERPWLTVQATFTNTSWTDSGIGSLLSVILIVVGVNGVTFSLYLRRMLSFMDPKNAVPKRVRNTLDTIASGIVLLDSEARIMVINDSFSNVCQKSREECIGGTLDQFEWVTVNQEVTPWQRAFESKTPCMATVELKTPKIATQIFNSNATPVFDASDGLAGVLVSFENVTEIEAQRKDLLKAFRELEQNREQIRRQNEALKEIALHDALTGAYNRRALFEHLDECWCKLDTFKNGLIGIMMDVDHFKKLNDVHGHAVGDAVLKDVARVVRNTVAMDGFTARYGGEEFCVILSDRTIEEGIGIAEKIRVAIETELAIPYRVTTSVGVSSSLFGASCGQSLIDQADKALYMAKHAGRNQTQTYSAEQFQESEKILKAANSAAKGVRKEVAISYQAAVSLHTALLYKHSPTAYHSQRVAELAVSLAKDILSVRDMYVLEVAALLHDIGKIAAADEYFLQLPPALFAMDDEQARSIVEHGIRIIQTSFDCEELTEAIRYHLYRYDGTNSGQKAPSKHDLPLLSRVLALANAYDELCYNKQGEKIRSHEEALMHLQLSSGTRFDPELIQRLVAHEVGWRIDGSYMQNAAQDREVIDLGYSLEQVLLAYDNGDVASLQKRLEGIRDISKRLEFEHISRMASELHANLDRKTAAELEGYVPILQDLVESCSTIMRGYLRSVASPTSEPNRVG